MSPFTNFSFVLPAGTPAALVCDSPQGGTRYPGDFGCGVALADLRKCEDTHVESLWDDEPRHGSVLLRAHLPRSHVDPSRACTDVEPAMPSEPWPGDVRPSRRCLEPGQGLLCSKTTTKAPISDRKPSVAEARSRTDTCWHPYRGARGDAIERARDRFGKAWHLRLHSMPSDAYERLRFVPVRPLADWCLATCAGIAARPASRAAWRRPSARWATACRSTTHVLARAWYAHTRRDLAHVLRCVVAFIEAEIGFRQTHRARYGVTP